MSEPEYFPEVSNWYRQDPEYESDTTDIWINEVFGIKMRVREITGPFSSNAVYVVETRPWGTHVGEGDTFTAIADSPYDMKSAAETAARLYAEDHNETEE